MMGRFSYKNRRKVREITDRAAQKARVPGAPSLGATPGAGQITAAIISPQINSRNYIDETGEPVRPFMTEVDVTNDPRRLTS